MALESLAAVFEQEDGQGIVDVFEVGPLVDPLIDLWVFGEFARKAEAVDLI